MLMKVLTSSWFAALMLQAILVGALALKRIWKKFPFFFAYSATNLSASILLYSFYLARLGRLYSTTYWLCEATALFLGLAVVWEIFDNLFTPYPALRKLGMQVLRAAILCLVVLGCVVAYKQPLGEHSRIQAAFMLVEQAGRILEVGLLLSLFSFASAFGLHWRQYVFGIALGLGIFVTVELVAITMRVQFGIAANSVFSVIRTVSYNSSLFIWIAYILAPELATQPSEMPKRAQLEQWNKAVMELIYQ